MITAHHQAILDLITRLRLDGQGCTKISHHLNREDLTGPLGGKWTPTSVKRQLILLGLSTEEAGCYQVRFAGPAPEEGSEIPFEVSGKTMIGKVKAVREGKLLLVPVQ